MDELTRRGIHALIKYPWMVTTQEAIEIHRSMAEVLQARSFSINWIINQVYYDDGSPLRVSVVKHLTKISENRETADQAFEVTSGAFDYALSDLSRVHIYQLTYQMPAPGEMVHYEDGRIYPAQLRLIRTRFSLDDMPIRGATYAFHIEGNI